MFQYLFVIIIIIYINYIRLNKFFNILILSLYKWMEITQI